MNKLFNKFKQFLAISFDVFYKFDGKNIQNIIVIEK